MIVFLQYPTAPSHNNVAEQAVRSPVTARSICGGIRSAQGSHSKMVFCILLETCVVRGLDPVTAQTDMLIGIPSSSILRLRQANYSETSELTRVALS